MAPRYRPRACPSTPPQPQCPPSRSTAPRRAGLVATQRTRPAYHRSAPDATHPHLVHGWMRAIRGNRRKRRYPSPSGKSWQRLASLVRPSFRPRCHIPRQPEPRSRCLPAEPASAQLPDRQTAGRAAEPAPWDRRSRSQPRRIRTASGAVSGVEAIASRSSCSCRLTAIVSVRRWSAAS